MVNACLLALKTSKRSTVFLFQIVDFKDLDKAVKGAKSVVIVGGGFLGSELACALGHRGTIIFDSVFHCILCIADNCNAHS